MSTFWRQVGMNYIQYSQICSTIVKQCIKAEFKPVETGVKVSALTITKWLDGKPTVVETSASGASK